MSSDITLFLNALVYGFCFTTFISYFLSLFKFKKLKKINNSFFQYAIKIIRIIAIGYFLCYLVRFIHYHITIDSSNYIERATGPYWFGYWMMLLQPFIFCMLIQLLWFPKFQKRSFLNFILVLVILFVTLASGANMERFVIIVTSFHRDYAPDSFYLYNMEMNLLNLILLGITIRILIFSSLVFVVRLIHKKLISNKL